MPHYIYRGVYAVDQQDDLAAWPGALLSLVNGCWPQTFALNLPISQNRALTDDAIRQGAAFIHAQRQAERKVLIYCPNCIPRGMVFVLAYLIEYEAMALPDAYTLLFNYRALMPPRDWIAALVRHYSLNYSSDQIRDDYFLMMMAVQCARTIHPIEHGIYISNIEAMQNPAPARELGIEAVLRVDNHDRASGQWPPDFILCDLPLRDGYAITADQLTTATRFIHQQVRAGRRVLVHCQEGISRSVTAVLAYLIEYAGMTLAEAAWLVLRKRPLAEPHPALIASLVAQYRLPYTAEQVHDWGFFHRLTRG